MTSELEARIEHLEGLLNAAAHERAGLLIDMERYRRALVRIADSESGIWGRIAHVALHPEREGT